MEEATQNLISVTQFLNGIKDTSIWFDEADEWIENDKENMKIGSSSYVIDIINIHRNLLVQQDEMIYN